MPDQNDPSQTLSGYESTYNTLANNNQTDATDSCRSTMSSLILDTMQTQTSVNESNGGT